MACVAVEFIWLTRVNFSMLLLSQSTVSIISLAMKSNPVVFIVTQELLNVIIVGLVGVLLMLFVNVLSALTKGQVSPPSFRLLWRFVLVMAFVSFVETLLLGLHQSHSISCAPNSAGVLVVICFLVQRTMLGLLILYSTKISITLGWKLRSTAANKGSQLKRSVDRIITFLYLGTRYIYIDKLNVSYFHFS